MNIMPLFAQSRCRWQSFWLIRLMPLTLYGQIAAAGIGGLNNGTYDAFDCAAEISDKRILIADDNVSFYESSCQLSVALPQIFTSTGMRGCSSDLRHP